jgi:hypothetical protein
MERRIKVKFDGKCRACTTPIPAGAEAIYTGRGTIFCNETCLHAIAPEERAPKAASPARPRKASGDLADAVCDAVLARCERDVRYAARLRNALVAAAEKVKAGEAEEAAA